MITKIYIGEKQLSLFQEENMSVNSSVASIDDITANTTDFTKTFTVPASAENNKLFRHYYNVDVEDGFDARVRRDGRIELDGGLFRIGKFSLIKASLKGGVPSNYTIQFIGNLIDMKDIFGDEDE